VFEEGLMASVAVDGPEFHWYEDAPFAVKVAEPPLQNTVEVAAMPIPGTGFTEMLCTAVLLQPVTADVPVTVNEALLFGLTA
jgi:hypothetical protein